MNGRWDDLSDGELAVRLAACGCPHVITSTLVAGRDDDETAALIDRWFNEEET